MGIPMMMYIVTKNEYWLRKTILLMAMDEKNIDDDTYEMVKCSFEHAVVKVGLPSNVPQEELRKFTAPTLMIAAENDCIFPGEKVINKAKAILPNLETVLPHGQGHLCVLPNNIKKRIVEFIAE